MKKSIAHIFSWSTNHLNQSIVPYVDSSEMNSCILLRDVGGLISIEKATIINKNWIEQLKYARFSGMLKRPVLSRLIGSGKVGIILSILLGDFSFSAWWNILRGPRYIMIHGNLPSFTTLAILYCLRKRVVYINWAGPPLVSGRYLGRINKVALKLLYKIIVLMRPEIQYFTKYVEQKRVELLPYPVLYKHESFLTYPERSIDKVLLIGNSNWCRDGYEFILDRITLNEWTKIICMMNYGMENDSERTDKFVAKYKQKFGDAFVPWREKVSIEEYKKIISEAPFYICPAMQQSGLGMIRQAILQGKAIFLNGDNLTWLKNDMGLEVYDLKLCKDFNFSTLRRFVPSRVACQKRFQKALNFWIKYHSVEIWRKNIVEVFK